MKKSTIEQEDEQTWKNLQIARVISRIVYVNTSYLIYNTIWVAVRDEIQSAYRRLLFTEVYSFIDTTLKEHHTP